MSTLKVNNIESFTAVNPVVINDELEISGSVDINGSIIPSTDESKDLGSTAKKWRRLHVDSAFIGNIATPVQIPTISGSINVSGSIIPSQDDTFDLGTTNNKWRNLHLDRIAFIDTATIGSASIDNLSGSLKVTSPQVDFTNLPTSDPGISGRLFTLSGSQLPFSGSVAELSAISSSKFVIISG